MQDIENEVKEFLKIRLKDLYNKNKFFIKPSDSLKELGFDSLDMIEMLFDLEAKYNITIPDATAKSLLTVGDITNTIKLYLKK